MHSFTLLDADGNPHAYEVIAPHGVADGWAITTELGAILAGPLGGLLLGGSATDLAKLGPALGAELLKLRDMSLVRRILVNTTRDGKPLSGAVGLDGYQRNYGELMLAVREVVSYNRFLPLPAGLGTVFSKIEGALTRLSAATPSKPQPSA